MLIFLSLGAFFYNRNEAYVVMAQHIQSKYGTFNFVHTRISVDLYLMISFQGQVKYHGR